MLGSRSWGLGLGCSGLGAWYWGLGVWSWGSGTGFWVSGVGVLVAGRLFLGLCSWGLGVLWSLGLGSWALVFWFLGFVLGFGSCRLGAWGLGGTSEKVTIVRGILIIWHSAGFFFLSISYGSQKNSQRQFSR